MRSTRYRPHEQEQRTQTIRRSLPALLLSVAVLATLALGGLASAEGAARPLSAGSTSPQSCPPLYNEIEPNNTITTATFITDIMGAEVRGGITPAGDVDYYSFQANAGDRIWSYVNTSNAAPSTDSVLTLLNSVSATLQLDDDNGFQSTLSSAIAGAPITQTGTYLLQMRQFGGATIMNPYSLYIDRTAGPPVPESEPNDTLLLANPYGFNTVVTASIPITTDLDYYTFTLAQNEKVVIQVDGDPDRNGTNLSRINQFNPNLDLLDSAGAVITAVDSDSQGGNGGLLSENLVYTNTSAISTTFAVRIKFDPSAPPDDDVGIYNLHIYKVGICGAVTVTPTGTATGTATTTAVSTATGTATTTAVSTATGTATTTAVSTATASPTACPLPFSDVPVEYWAYGYIKWAYCTGIISGYSDGTFRPENSTTRGQTAKMVVGAAGWPMTLPAGAPHFSDVPPGSTFYTYIEVAWAHGIIGGYSDGTFRPANPVTRGQLTKMVVLARGLALITPATPTFSDVPPGSPFYTYIETAAAHDIVGGYSDGTFRPANDATRAQLTKILYQAYAVPALQPQP